MIKPIINRDPEFRFFDCFPSVVPHRGWLYPGYILNLYWFRIEIAKVWEES
jgi:hypothetical protein